MPPTYPELLTIPEAARYLGVSQVAVRGFIHDGQLPAVCLGGYWRIVKSVLDRNRSVGDVSRRGTAVLAVGADHLTSEVIKRVAARFQRELIAAPSVAEARQILSMGSICLVLADEKLPDEHVGDWHARIRTALPDVPLGVFCERVDALMLSRLLQSGPVSLIRKPAQFDEVRRFFAEIGLRSGPLE